MVYVATERDTVDALRADTGAIVWTRTVATPVPATALPCGDITPTVGITATMVLDPATATLYASAATWTGERVAHRLFALDAATGALRWDRDLDQPGWDPAAQLQRAALALDAGQVLVGFGGNYGDCADYHGWLVAVPVTGRGPLRTYRVPTSREGAIWAASGFAVDPAGRVFVATGNGAAGPGAAFDHGDAVIALSPSLTELQVFAPAGWAQDNAADADLGSTSPILLDDGRLFVVGKQAVAELLDADHLGGIGGQLASLALCPSLGGNAAGGTSVDVVCPAQGRIVQVKTGPASLARGWTWTSPTGGAGSPTLAGGLLWTIDAGARRLYGLDPWSGTTMIDLPLATGEPGHFAAPAAADGVLVVAGSTAVEAFEGDGPAGQP